MPIRLTRVLIVLALGVFWSGCGEPTPPEEYAARVGDAYLTESEVRQAITGSHPATDSTTARQQYIEQWVTNELLYREAERHDLANEPAVQQKLRAQERSVLINELTSRLFENMSAAPSPAQIATYYERNKEQLRLREPFARIRYLATTNINTARSVHEELVDLDDSASADSLWDVFIERYAADPAEARELAAHHYPVSNLFPRHPAVREALNELVPGETAPVVRSRGLAHVVQLVDRVAAGTVPELNWVEDTIRRRLQIRARKQMYEREVQRLRNEARADDQIEIR